tara:strand:+ start:296 stop:514 length:219 start_codon:yes stop_codon:yes gene_type:complete
MAVIGEKAPNLKLGKWVQGMDTNFDKEGDNVKLVEVFQVNCPGCFMHSIPEIKHLSKIQRRWIISNGRSNRI